MKRFILPLLFLLPTLLFGQNIGVSAYVQQTIMGLQKGVELTSTLNNGFGIGVFYQASQKVSFKESAINYPFNGIDFLFPIVGKCEKVSVQGSLKAGFINQHFLAITPEIDTNLKLTKHLSLVLGAGYRSGQAAVSAKLNFNLLNK